MKKKTKAILNETLDKALAAPKKRDTTKLDDLLNPYDVPVKPPLELVEQPPTSLPKISENTGQPANQTVVNQLTTLANQLASQPANQNTGQPANQLTSPENYPSRRLRKQKGLRLPVQKLEKWELWCYLNKVDFQDAVEQAMDWLTSQPVSHILIDDLEEIGTTDEILIFYHRWTGNRITPKDKDARETVRRFSDDVCKIGIAISIYRAKAKINSFKYCIGAIEEAAATPLENTGNYLKYLEQTILNKKAK